MIWDGYNETRTVAGYSFICRPLLRQQRAAIKEQTRHLPQELFQLMMHRIADSRIVECDWEGGTLLLPDEVFEKIWSITLGVGRDEQEKADEKNLADGVRLWLRYPSLARTSCESCRHWWYVPLEGRIVRRAGVAQRRPKDSMLLCQTEQGCPAGTPDHPRRLSEKNIQAYRHYQECGGRVPDDPVCLRNARIIDGVTADLRAAEGGHGRAVRRSGTAAEHRHVPEPGRHVRPGTAAAHSRAADAQRRRAGRAGH